MSLHLSTGLRNALLGTGDWKTLFTDGIMNIYSGSPPASADDVETGVLLVSITVASGAFVAGSPDNGLEFDTPAAGVLSKNGYTWSGVGLVTGEAGYYRFYDNFYEAGASGTAIRFDGTCAVTGGDLSMIDLTVTSMLTTTVNTFYVTLPAE